MSSFTFNIGSPRLAIAGGALALAGGMLGGGCGGGPSFDYTTEADFCQALATVDCGQATVDACYGANDTSIDMDTQLCITARSTPERCNPQGLPYNSTYAQDCVDAHTNVYQNSPNLPSLDPGLLQAMTQACEGVFNKGGAHGATCTADTDCAVIPAVEMMAGYSCVFHKGMGTCQIPNPVNAGDTCTNPADQCPDGYSCQAGGTGEYCIANPGAGQACGPGITCGSSMSPLRCDTTTKLCATQLGDNSPCKDPSDCAGGFCILTSSGGLCSHTYTLAFGSPTCADFVSK
jgi:hypothetical protein